MFSTSSNLGGSIGTARTSLMLSGNPSVDAVRGICVLSAASAQVDTTNATRLEA